MKRILLFLLIPTLSFSVLTAQSSWNEINKLVASDRSDQDFFGIKSDIDGDYAVVGSSQQEFDADGLNNLSNAGAAYIFEKDLSGSWVQVDKLVPNDRNENDYFGSSVSISGDYVIIGSPFESSGTDDILLGNSGSAYIFERDESGNWTQVQKLAPLDRDNGDFFGNSVSIYGNMAIVSATKDEHDVEGSNELTSAGSVYIFERNGEGVWEEKQKIVAADRASADEFGWSLSTDGNTIVVGSYFNATDSLSLNSLTFAGAIYLFEKIGGDDFVQVQKIVPSDRALADFFAFSVDVSGDYIISGAFGEDEDENGSNTLSKAGSAYLFKKNNSTGFWEEVRKIVPSDRVAGDEFGKSVSIDGDVVLISSSRHSFDANGENELSEAGAAYIYRKNISDVWALDQKISVSDRVANDRVATSLGLSGNNLIMGSSNQAYDSEGLNELTSAGAAYIYNYGTLTNISTQQQLLSNGLLVYPNPSNGVLNIQFEQGLAQVEVRLVNSLGQDVFYRTYDDVLKITEDLNLNAGLYFVQVKSSNNTLLTERFIVN